MQSALHADADGTAVPASSPFLAVYVAVEQFLTDPSPATVPVWTGAARTSSPPSGARPRCTRVCAHYLPCRARCGFVASGAGMALCPCP